MSNDKTTPPSPDALVDQLRAWDWLAEYANGGWELRSEATHALHHVTSKAADEIERLVAENARQQVRARDTNEALRAALRDDIEGMERERIERLADDRDQLRAELAAAARRQPPETAAARSRGGRVRASPR